MKLFLILSIIYCWQSCICSSHGKHHESRSNNELNSHNLPIITRVPEECTDGEHVIINKLLKESSNGSHFYYAIYGNHKYYMKIDGITKDHLPIVRLENQPKKYDKNAKHMLRHAKQVIEYVFEDNGYSYRNGTSIQFIGFNSVWLGCPQQLCLSGNIDAATSLPNGTVYVFRGNYYWDLKNPPLVKNAMRISRWKGNTTRKLYFDSGYFNSVVSNLNFTTFYKGNLQYFWDNESIQEQPIMLTASEFQFKMDSGFFIFDGSVGLTYSLRRNLYVIDSNPFKVHKIERLGIPWNRTDAAFAKDKTIHIFKDWYYIKLSHNFPISNQPRLIFEDIFKCPKNLYHMFGGYQQFLQKYIPLRVARKVLDKFKDNNEDPNQSHINVNNEEIVGHESVVITVIIMFFIITIVIFIVLRRKNRIQRFKAQTPLLIK